MDNHKPLLSVGMPAYNSEQDIRDAIEAILNQTFTDFELIISDNASTDGTQSICEDYAQKDSRITYIRNDINLGASGNYNNVFKHSKGKYFKWASSNDYCSPTFFEQCIHALESDSDVAVAFPRTRLYSGSLENYSDYKDPVATSSANPMTRMLHVIDNIRLNNVMNGIIRSDALSKTPLIIPFFASDSCLMCELALYGKIVEIPEYLFYRQMDEESSTSMQDEETMLEHYQPGSKKPMRFQHWKIHNYYFAAIRRAKLPIGESLSIKKELYRRMVWHKNMLLKDFLFWKPFRSKSTTDWKAL
jgi:glycosyltransferase involved in cell wall biosynthesis